MIQAPNGNIFLIDAGPNDKIIGGNFDAGESVVVPHLNKIGAQSIDGIVISHPHLDHYGGVFFVLEKFNVREVVDPGFPSSSPHYLKLLQEIDKRNIPYKVAKEKDQLDWGPEIKAEVLGPREKSLSKRSAMDSINNRSLVLKLTYDQVSFLFTGDIESESEDRIAELFSETLRSDVLKVAHHGSKTSSTQKFLEAVQPSIAVISCGKKNDYGHPHRSVLKRLSKNKIRIYRTDRTGSIQIITDGSRYQIRTLKRS